MYHIFMANKFNTRKVCLHHYYLAKKLSISFSEVFHHSDPPTGVGSHLKLKITTVGCYKYEACKKYVLKESGVCVCV